MQLYEGPPFIPTLIGLFAVSEILSNVENFSADKKIAPEKVTQILPTVADMKRCFSTYVKGGIIGTFIGSIPGAMIGGLVLGIIEILAKTYISSQLSDAIVFGILIVVLLFKPTGLLGKVVQEKV